MASRMRVRYLMLSFLSIRLLSEVIRDVTHSRIRIIWLIKRRNHIGQEVWLSMMEIKTMLISMVLKTIGQATKLMEVMLETG